MQRVIIIPEKEFENLRHDIIREIHEFSKRSFGFKMISRDTGEEITDDDMVQGMLSHPIERVFKEYLGGD